MYTIKKLDSMADKDFIISILNDRKCKLSNCYSPLSLKLDKAIRFLNNI